MKDRSKHFLRLALANQAMREADAMASHIMTTKIAPGSDLYHAAVAGMVTSYCRPFMSATGLGPLSSEFGRFKDAPHPKSYTQLHLDLFTARDKIAAHFDLEYGEGQFHQKKYTLHPGEVELTLERHRFGVSTNHTTLGPDSIGFIRLLIAFQMKRIDAAQATFAISIAKEANGRLGAYVFTPARKNA
ncbi:hypothetical protein [Horticoccus sp. 23ND18S-11]|uniref:hypothetical protein n=1 Tax=Horticoccus sp. 23ND18S-11 TaxID=3391832 RepID=UPI0039C8DB7A